jgi:hypothetical protein
MTIVLGAKFDGGLAVAYDLRHTSDDGSMRLEEKVLLAGNLFVSFAGRLHEKSNLMDCLHMGNWVANNNPELPKSDSDSSDYIPGIVLSKERGDDEKSLLALEYALQFRWASIDWEKKKTLRDAEFYLMGFLGKSGPRLFYVNGHERRVSELDDSIFVMGDGYRYGGVQSHLKQYRQPFRNYIDAVCFLSEAVTIALAEDKGASLEGRGCFFMTNSGRYLWH